MGVSRVVMGVGQCRQGGGAGPAALAQQAAHAVLEHHARGQRGRRQLILRQAAQQVHAARRGVEVTLILQGMPDMPWVRLCSRLLVIDHGRKIAEGRPRELIAQHLEAEVVEVYGTGALALVEAAEHEGLRALAARVEVSGETVFFYTPDAQPLLQALAPMHQLRTLHRPANLEDLFLKLTGRQIREEG